MLVMENKKKIFLFLMKIEKAILLILFKSFREKKFLSKAVYFLRIFVVCRIKFCFK